MSGSVNSNFTFFGGCSTSREQLGGARLTGADANSPNTNKSGLKSINASGLNDRLDPVSARLKSARKQAMKFIKDALAGELSIDDDMKKRNDHIGKLGSTINDARGSIRKIDDEIEELKDKYEGEEYQSRVQSLLMDREAYADTLKNSEAEVRIENMTVRDMSIERLKTDPMGDARDEADAVMESAGKEVVNMLVGEAQDHINEELEEKKKKAKEAEEEKEKLEERIDAAKEREKKQEEFTEDILETVSEQSIKDLDMSDPNSGINDLMNKLKLIEYDVKGAIVDEEV